MYSMNQFLKRQSLQFIVSLGRTFKPYRYSTKISPAAQWHAATLKINLEVERINGSGPKGHILKSDILEFENKRNNYKNSSSILTSNSNSNLNHPIHKTTDHSLIIRITDSVLPSKEIIQKCLNSISKRKSFEISFELLPEIGIQVHVKNSTMDIDKISSLLKLYLKDTHHLLL